MATRYFLFHRLATLPAFALLALVAVPSCAMGPPPAPGDSRTSLERVGHQPQARKKKSAPI
jgi:hypothetical protein